MLKQTGLLTLNWQPIQVWNTELISSSVLLWVKDVCLTLPLCDGSYSNKFPYWKLWLCFLGNLPTCARDQGHTPVGMFFFLSVIDYTGSLLPIKFPQTDSLYLAIDKTKLT